jgi:hypothetical protein
MMGVTLGSNLIHISHVAAEAAVHLRVIMELRQERVVSEVPEVGVVLVTSSLKATLTEQEAVQGQVHRGKEMRVVPALLFHPHMRISVAEEEVAEQVAQAVRARQLRGLAVAATVASVCNGIMEITMRGEGLAREKQERTFLRQTHHKPQEDSAAVVTVVCTKMEQSLADMLPPKET